MAKIVTDPDGRKHIELTPQEGRAMSRYFDDLRSDLNIAAFQARLRRRLVIAGKCVVLLLISPILIPMVLSVGLMYMWELLKGIVRDALASGETP